MADAKITALTALTVVETGDLLPVVDVDDTTDDAAGTTKKILVSHVVGGVPGMNIETLSADRDLYANTDCIDQVFLGTYTVNLKNTGAIAGNIFRIKCNKTYSEGSYLSIFFEGLGTVDYISAQSTKTYIFNGTNWVSGGLGAGDDSSSGFNNIAIGAKAVAANGTIAIGVGATCAGNGDGIAIGRGANSQGGTRAIALGGASYGYDDSVTVGHGNYLGEYYVAAIGNYCNVVKRYGFGKGYYATVKRVGEECRTIDIDNLNRYADTAYILTTTNATATEMFLYGYSTSRADVTTNSSFSFIIHATARQNATGDTKSIELKGCIKNISGTVSLVGTVTSTVIAEDAGASAWTLVATADDTNNSLCLTATGEADHTIKWIAKLSIIEVS